MATRGYSLANQLQQEEVPLKDIANNMCHCFSPFESATEIDLPPLT